MNLIVGATGYVSGEICRLLIAAGRPVRALARETADPAQGLGVEQVCGDLKDPESLARACEGVVWADPHPPHDQRRHPRGRDLHGGHGPGLRRATDLGPGLCRPGADARRPLTGATAHALDEDRGDPERRP
jgi:hypothetical protein